MSADTFIPHEPQPWPVGKYKRYRSRNGCVRNATLLVYDHPDDLRVAKGYADTNGIWVGHWWCVDSEGRVVDPTWKNAGLSYVAIEILDAKAAAERALSENAWELGLEQIASPELLPALEHARTVHPR